METPTVKFAEVLVLGNRTIDGKKALVRLNRPQERAPLVPETVLVISNIPISLALMSRQSLLQTWVYARFTISSAFGEKESDALDLGKNTVALDWLPSGLIAEVRHVPLYSEPLPPQMVWPYWVMPPRKGWLFPRDIRV